MSTGEIASKVGVTVPAVAAMLKKLGVIRTNSETWNLPGRHHPLATREWLEQKYLVEKLDMVQIGKILNRDPKTIFRLMRKYGIPTRPRGSNRDQNLLNGRPKGYKHTPETVKKIRLDAIKKGKVPYLKNGSHYIKGKRGNVVWNWKGGITPERQEFYRSQEWKEAVKAVWKRDNAICQRCKLDHRTLNRETARKFHIHHIASFEVRELRANPDNLILLCHPCHMWVHSSKNVNKEFIKEV